jgi:hypothetical protein
MQHDDKRTVDQLNGLELRPPELSMQFASKFPPGLTRRGEGHRESPRFGLKKCPEAVVVESSKAVREKPRSVRRALGKFDA